MDTTILTRLERCPAPAKINLFLHITGRRADGYHLLQSVFRLLDWQDFLSFEPRNDGQIVRRSPLPGVPAEQDLCVRAARLLQQATGCGHGADIHLEKHLPMGGGLGGGSSNAATTLMALNRLWATGLSRSELAGLGLKLGADVPFFVQGHDAFVEGVGEKIRPMTLPEARYVILCPPVNVSTAEIFGAKELTRNAKPLRIMDFAYDATRNDLQPVACRLHPEIGRAIEWLEQFAPARMTGSGACVFAEVGSEECAGRIIAACPERWLARHAYSLSRHPLDGWVA